jgi:LPXTG-motif cell wall-anchored protein
MKLAGKRLGFGAAALLTLLTMALIAPVGASAHQVADGNDGVCPNYSTGHLSANNQTSFTYTAPAGKLIVKVCVKAGSANQGDGPETYYDGPGVASVTISHSSGKQISHFSVQLVDKPTEPTKVEPTYSYTPPTCATEGTLDVSGGTGYSWQANGDGTYTAVAAPNYELVNDPSPLGPFELDKLPSPSEQCPMNVEPVVPTFTEGDCDFGPAVAAPETEAYTVAISGTVGFDQTITVTFTAKSGYVLTGTTVYEHTFGSQPKYSEGNDPPSHDPPTHTPVCGPVNDTVTVPADTNEVDYQDSGWTNGSRTVTAVWIDDNSTLEMWSFTDQNTPCPTAPPTVVSGYDCVADEPTAYLDPASNDTWTATGDLDDAPRGYRFVITANDGYTFESDIDVVLEGTIDDSDRTCEVEPVKPTRNGTEECDVPDTYTIPATLGVVYLVDGEVVDAGTYPLPEGHTVVVTAEAASGYRLVGGLNQRLTGGEVDACPIPDWTSNCAEIDWVVTNTGDVDLVVVFTGYPSTVIPVGESLTVPEGIDTIWVNDEEMSRPDGCEATPTTTTQPPTTTDPASLDITAIGPVCLNDAPYIDVTFGDQPQFNGRPATVTFIDLGGNVVETETATYQAGTTVRFVYPGASVDAAGNPVDWPGWMFDGDEWVVDPSDAHLRDGLTVVVEVNPTASATVSYPPATAACAANPPTTPDPAPTTTGVAPVGELPQTGSSTGVLAAVAAALLVAGGATLLITRRSTARR